MIGFRASSFVALVLLAASTVFFLGCGGGGGTASTPKNLEFSSSFTREVERAGRPLEAVPSIDEYEPGDYRSLVHRYLVGFHAYVGRLEALEAPPQCRSAVTGIEDLTRGSLKVFLAEVRAYEDGGETALRAVESAGERVKKARERALASVAREAIDAGC